LQVRSLDGLDSELFVSTYKNFILEEGGRRYAAYEITKEGKFDSACSVSVAVE
jgi:hypothetical protein